MQSVLESSKGNQHNYCNFPLTLTNHNLDMFFNHTRWILQYYCNNVAIIIAIMQYYCNNETSIASFFLVLLKPKDEVLQNKHVLMFRLTELHL